jgi:hypothetical protein
VNFDAEAVELGMRLRERQQRLAGAKADFQHARRASSKYLVEIERLRAEFHSIARPQFIQGALLGGCRAAAANDKTADTAT